MAAKKPLSLELSIEKPKFYYRPYFNTRKNGTSTVQEPNLPGRIFVIGCGGNGGYLVPWMARYLSQSRSDMLRGIEITLIDGDIVEEKNIIRQNFLLDEVGENKAVAVADRCNRNMGMDIRAIPEYFSEKVLNRDIPHGSLVFGCVDRHEVRKILSHWVERQNSNFYVDVGNELSAGQLFLSGWPKNFSGDRTYPEVNNAEPILIHKFYPTIEKADVQKAAPSCADATAGGLQRMGVNLTAATLAFRTFEALMSPAEIPYHEVTFGQDSFKTNWIKDLVETKSERSGRPMLSTKS